MNELLMMIPAHTHMIAPTRPTLTVCEQAGCPDRRVGDERSEKRTAMTCQNCGRTIDLWEAMASDSMNPERADRAWALLGLPPRRPTGRAW